MLDFIFQNDSSIIILFVFLVAGSIFSYIKKNKSNFFDGTSVIDSFSKDVTALAKNGFLDPVVGREKEIKHLSIVLSRRTKNNAVLIGAAGVGKTTIVEGLAHNIIAGNVPPSLRGKRVLSLDLNLLLAGTKYRGEFENRVRKITDEISGSKRSIILFIDEIHNLVEAESSGGSVSVGDIFKPAMARGELQIIGATTEEEYDQYFPRDLAFKRRLQPIFVSEPTEKETLEILRGIRKKYEEHHNVKISDVILRACIEQSKKMLIGRSFPDKAIDLMDEAAGKTRLECIVSTQTKCQVKPDVKVEDVKKIAEEYREVKS